jgi:hypothetical protein
MRPQPAAGAAFPSGHSGSCVVVGQGVRFAEAARISQIASGTARPRIGVETKALARVDGEGSERRSDNPRHQRAGRQGWRLRRLGPWTHPIFDRSPALRRSDFTSPTALAMVQVQTHDRRSRAALGVCLGCGLAGSPLCWPGPSGMSTFASARSCSTARDRQPARVRGPPR